LINYTSENHEKKFSTLKEYQKIIKNKRNQPSSSNTNHTTGGSFAQNTKLRDTADSIFNPYNS